MSTKVFASRLSQAQADKLEEISRKTGAAPNALIKESVESYLRIPELVTTFVDNTAKVAGMKGSEVIEDALVDLAARIAAFDEAFGDDLPQFNDLAVLPFDYVCQPRNADALYEIQKKRWLAYFDKLLDALGEKSLIEVKALRAKTAKKGQKTAQKRKKTA